MTIPRRHYNDLKAAMKLNQGITAPIIKGKGYGSIDISFAGTPLVNKPLVALKDVATGNFIQRFYDKLMLMME